MYMYANEPLFGVIPEQCQSNPVCMPYLKQRSKKQGASHEISKGAGSRQMIILEQVAQKIIKSSMGQRKIMRHRGHGGGEKIKEQDNKIIEK